MTDVSAMTEWADVWIRLDSANTRYLLFYHFIIIPAVDCIRVTTGLASFPAQLWLPAPVERLDAGRTRPNVDH